MHGESVASAAEAASLSGLDGWAEVQALPVPAFVIPVPERSELARLRFER